MSAENETLTGIANEIRARAVAWSEESLKQYDLRLADRIEAAAKRERDNAATYAYDPTKAGKSELPDGSAYALEGFKVSDVFKVSDMVAMRKALVKVSEWMAHRIATGGFEASPTIPTVLEDIVLPALAAPPRNCDNAATWLDLYSHFHPPKGMREMPPEWVDAIAAFCQWLVATPKKGGAK